MQVNIYCKMNYLFCKTPYIEVTPAHAAKGEELAA